MNFKIFTKISGLVLFLLQLTSMAMGPKPPTDLKIISQTMSQIRVEWKDQSSNESHFVLERSSSDGTMVPIATLPANTIKFADAVPTPGLNYCYRISAFDDSKSSQSSNTICASAIPRISLLNSIGLPAGSGSNYPGTVVSGNQVIIPTVNGVHVYERDDAGALSYLQYIGTPVDAYCAPNCSFAMGGYVLQVHNDWMAINGPVPRVHYVQGQSDAAIYLLRFENKQWVVKQILSGLRFNKLVMDENHIAVSIDVNYATGGNPGIQIYKRVGEFWEQRQKIGRS